MRALKVSSRYQALASDRFLRKTTRLSNEADLSGLHFIHGLLLAMGVPGYSEQCAATISKQLKESK